MAIIDICGATYDVDLVVFDKDGTLVDFDRLWAGRTERGVDRALAAAGLPAHLRSGFLKVFGVESATSKVIPESPLAVSTLAKLGLVCAVLLHQAGIPWHLAEALAANEFMPEIDTQPTAADILPIGDVAGLMHRLKAQGIRIGICTSDDRAATTAALPLLGIADVVDILVCGNDPLPNKPDPETLWSIGRAFGIAPGRMAMVGDSVTDMRTGRNAGVACTLGVLSGTGERPAMAAYADHIAADIHAIRCGGA